MQATSNQKFWLPAVAALAMLLAITATVGSFFGSDDEIEPFIVVKGASLMTYTDNDYMAAIEIAAEVSEVVIQAIPAAFAADGMPPDLLQQILDSPAYDQGYGITAELARELEGYTDFVLVAPQVFPGDHFFPGEPEKFFSPNHR